MADPHQSGGWTIARVLALLFLLIALPTGALLALVTPPGQVADEPTHVLRAGSLLHLQIVGRRTPERMPDGVTRLRGGIDADPALLAVLEGPGWPALDQSRIDRLRKLPWEGRLAFFGLSNTAIYLPVLYAPAALGLAAAQLAGAGPYDAVQAGRLVNLACLLLLGGGALLLAGRGHAGLFLVLTVPMTLSLGASFNQDGLLIGASALAAALLTRPGRRSYWTAALLLGLVVAVKLPYAPMLAALLPPLGQGWARRACVAVAASLPGLAWSLHAFRHVSSPYIRAPYEAGPLWPGPRPALFDGTSPAAQLMVLAADPLQAAVMTWASIAQAGRLLREAAGVLGWLNVPLPGWLYLLWAAAALAALLSDLVAPRQAEGARLTETALMLAAAVACVLLIHVSQYLAWTDVGKTSIDGLSGRYFLPILPFLATHAPRLGSPRTRALRVACLALPVAAAAAGVIALPRLIAAAYYPG